MDDVEVIYSGLMEISQGGPEVGTISVNGMTILSYRFGGPFLSKDKYIFAPVYVKKFFGFGFKLAKINTKDLNVEILGKIKDLIFLDKTEGNRVYFFEDLDKTIARHYNF